MKSELSFFENFEKGRAKSVPYSSLKILLEIIEVHEPLQLRQSGLAELHQEI